MKIIFHYFQSKFLGGTIKFFGDELNPIIPYKTLLLSINDTAEWTIKEILDKYGLKHEDPQKYSLVQVNKHLILYFG